MKKVLLWGWRIIEVLIILHVLVITTLILFKNKYGYTQIGDSTLYPVIKVDKNFNNVNYGDLLIIERDGKIDSNDTIYYYSVVNESYTVSVDKVKKVDRSEKNELYTIDSDSSVSISSSRILGKKAKRIPKVGRILQTLEDKNGFLFGVLLPIVLVFIYQVYNFIKALRYEDIKDLDKEDTENDYNNTISINSLNETNQDNIKSETDQDNTNNLVKEEDTLKQETEENKEKVLNQVEEDKKVILDDTEIL